MEQFLNDYLQSVLTRAKEIYDTTLIAIGYMKFGTTAADSTDGGTEYTQRLSLEGKQIGCYLLGYFQNDIIDCINRWLISVKGVNLDQLAESLKMR